MAKYDTRVEGSTRDTTTHESVHDGARREPPRRGTAAFPPRDPLQRILGPHIAVQMLAQDGHTGLRSAEVLRSAAAGIAGPGAPLPHLEPLQRAFGSRDLGQVRAHTDAAAVDAAGSIGARAYAFGNRIAFADPNPSLHVVAHEVAHTFQQQQGVQLKGGVGEAGDPYERQADAIADAVCRGENVEAMLGPIAAAPPVPPPPVVQRLNVDAATERAIKKRIADRGGKNRAGRPLGKAVTAGIDDRYFSFESDKALGAIGVASMADNPEFEARAERFEARIGSLAYNHPRAKAVGRAGGLKVLAYINRKYQHAQDSLAKINHELSSFGIDRPDWSGAVGKSAAAIRNVLRRGSVSEQVAHVESFVCNVLNTDMMENKNAWHFFADRTGFNMPALDRARERVKDTGDRYLAYEVPEGGAAARQWHTRVGVGKIKQEGELESVPMHPSAVSQYGMDNESEATTTRKKQQVESAFPVGLGVKLGEEEARFQQTATGSPDLLKWEEGARVWVLNELDTWVHAQRVLSMPLAGGTSSTAARIMQSFDFLGVGPPDDVRLAAIGALLPPRHHSLVEIMFAAQPFGATPFTPGPRMYHELAPLTELEVRSVVDLYPDETPPGERPRLARQAPIPRVPAPLAPAPPQAAVAAPRVAPRLTSEQQSLQELTGTLRDGLPQSAPKFTRTRASLSAQGVSNVFKDRNSSQARMLRAIDAYHALKPTDTLARLRTLITIRDEATHWLSKHSTWTFHLDATIAVFKAVRDEAAAVLAHHENQYLLDLASDNMLADSHHAYQGTELVKGARKDQGHTPGQALIKKYGLTEAECAAIATYVGPSYKFINAGLENDPNRMVGRLMGFVSETQESFSEKRVDKDAAASKARRKLRGLRNKKQGAIDEAHRHAVVATLGLDKLPPYTGMVYAGGALTRKEALARFKTGEVQQRAAFASTTSAKNVADMFAATKWYELNQAHEIDPTEDNAPFAYVLTYRSKTGRDIADFSHKPGEHEILFAPNSKLRITTGAAEGKPNPDKQGYFMIEAEEVV